MSRVAAGVQFAGGVLLLALWPSKAVGQLTLSVVEKAVTSSFDLAEITSHELEARLSSSDSSRYVIFDSRAREEYDTSHLQSAIHVAPEASSAQFQKVHGAKLAGKHVVIYCSVGYRSSTLAKRIGKAATEDGAKSVANLRGGIFRWYNEKKPVFDEHGETHSVHPFDNFWGKLLKQRSVQDSAGADADGDGG